LPPEAKVGRGRWSNFVFFDGGLAYLKLIIKPVVIAKSIYPISTIFTIGLTLDDEEFEAVAGTFGFEVSLEVWNIELFG